VPPGVVTRILPSVALTGTVVVIRVRFRSSRLILASRTKPNSSRETGDWRVRRIINRQQWLPVHSQFSAHCQGAACRGSMRDEDTVGDGTYEAVSIVGEGGRHPLVLWLERRRAETGGTASR